MLVSLPLRVLCREDCKGLCTVCGQDLNQRECGCERKPTDPRWAGAESSVFLRHALELASDRGYRLVNVDCTVLLERPKLKDYRTAIREKLAATLSLDLDRVSVKFKTSEKLGPVGESRAAEAQAVVTLARD